MDWLDIGMGKDMHALKKTARAERAVSILPVRRVQTRRIT